MSPYLTDTWYGTIIWTWALATIATALYVMFIMDQRRISSKKTLGVLAFFGAIGTVAAVLRIILNIQPITIRLVDIIGVTSVIMAIVACAIILYNSFTFDKRIDEIFDALLNKKEES